MTGPRSTKAGGAEGQDGGTLTELGKKSLHSVLPSLTGSC